MLLLLALIPALTLLVYYYFRDRHPEPWLWVLAVFFAGALSCGIAYPLERLAQTFFPLEDRTGFMLLLECVFVPGLIEETVKLSVVVALVFWRNDFDDPVDGLIYATAAALGFTYGEDLVYYLRHGADWSRVFSTASHPWFSCFWGACLGWAKFMPWRRGVALVAAGLAASIGVHALFDFIILTAEQSADLAWLRIFLPPLLIALFLIMEWKLEKMQPLPKAAVSA